MPLIEWEKTRAEIDPDFSCLPPFEACVRNAGKKLEEIEELVLIASVPKTTREFMTFLMLPCPRDGFEDACEKMVKLRRVCYDMRPLQASKRHGSQNICLQMNELRRIIAAAYPDGRVVLMFKAAANGRYPLVIRGSTKAMGNVFVPMNEVREKEVGFWKGVKGKVKGAVLHDTFERFLLVRNSVPQVPTLEALSEEQHIKVVMEHDRFLEIGPRPGYELVAGKNPVARPLEDHNYFNVLSLEEVSSPSFNLKTLHLEGVRFDPNRYKEHFYVTFTYSTYSHLSALIVSQRATLRSLILRNCWMPRFVHKSYRNAFVDDWTTCLGEVGAVGLPVLQKCVLEELFDAEHPQGIKKAVLGRIAADLLVDEGFGKGILGEQVECQKRRRSKLTGFV